MTLHLTAFPTRVALMQATADRIAAALRDGLAARGQASAVLSGGGTPEPAYQALGKMNLDWPKITFALVDERFVPPTHDASNEALLRRTLAAALDRGARLLPMYAPMTLQDAADRADRLYAPLAPDIALMGMGDDGHTASWFPGAPKLDEALDLAATRTVVAQRVANVAGAPERLTLTRAGLARAGAVLLLIAGDAKRARLEAALGRAPWAPVAALFEPPLPAPETYWAP